MASPAHRCLLWAIDPHDLPPDFFEHTGGVLRMLHQVTGLRIVPIHILNWSVLPLPSADYRSFVEQAMPEVIHQIGDLVEALGLEGITEDPVVLEQSSFSPREAAETLSNFAKRIHAAVLVLNSHGRSGVRRLVLGSFAEALLLVSETPVAVVGAEVTMNPKQPHILLPTVFHSTSHLVFRQAVGLARALNAKMTLLSSVSDPEAVLFQSGATLLGGAWMPVYLQINLSKELRVLSRRLRYWSSWALERGVSVDYDLHTEGGPVAELIVKQAEDKRSSLIIIEEHASAFQATFIGSVTRQVIRKAPCPVLVFRSDALSTLTRKEMGDLFGPDLSLAKAGQPEAERRSVGQDLDDEDQNLRSQKPSKKGSRSTAA